MASPPPWQVYVALLRAVNVAGRGSVSMKDLRALFEALPAEDVSTYLQSGNVVFRSMASETAAVSQAVEEQLAAQLGLRVSVIIRTGAELAEVVAGNPFLARGCDQTRLHVTFLAATPDPHRIPGLAPVDAGLDEFKVAGRHVYVHCPGGYGRTKINNGFFEKKLSVAATTRNWRSVTTLEGMAGSLAAKTDEGDV